MSYVKYREDDIKINNHRLHLRQGGLLKKRKPEVHFYECKYCYQLFTSKSDLIGHIRNAHNIVRPVIIINDKVVGDHTVLQYIEHAKILMYGFDGEIVIGGTVLKYDGSEEIDITRILEDKLSENGCCTIIANNVPVTIELHPLSIDDNSEMKAVLDEWQNAVSRGLAPNPTYLKAFDGGDRLFMDGIYNYYLACTAKHHKTDRYDAADAALRQFHDLPGLGKCVRKAIAFRRNWIDTLRMLNDGDSDIFTTFSEFFDGQSSSFDYEAESIENQLFVEDRTKMVLDLVVLFQKGRYSEVKQKLSELGNIEDLNDMNLLDQIYLIQARTADAEEDEDQASYYYGELITPAFCKKYTRRKVKR